MEITNIRHVSAPLASQMSNAFINFKTMTTNVVAVETDVVMNGEPVIGYGFSSKRTLLLHQRARYGYLGCPCQDSGEAAVEDPVAAL